MTPYYSYQVLYCRAVPTFTLFSAKICKAKNTQWNLGRFYFVQRCCPVEEHGVSLVNIVEVIYHFRRNILVI